MFLEVLSELNGRIDDLRQLQPDESRESLVDGDGFALDLYEELSDLDSERADEWLFTDDSPTGEYLIGAPGLLGLDDIGLTAEVQE